MNGAGVRARWPIGDVLDRSDLGALLDELAGSAGRAGPQRRWHCPAPDHDDHRASVTMHRDRHGHGRWRCWSGDHRGDAIDLVMLTTSRDRADAVDWLAARAGMIADRPLPAVPARTGSVSSSAVVMDGAVQRYVEVCERILDSGHGRVVRDWFHARGFTDATIVDNRLGCDPGRDLLRRQRGLPYGVLVAAVFPAFDPAGNVTYVQARYLDPDGAGRKYDNPSAALAPHPRLAYPIGDGGRDRLLVCEGVPDALIATQARYRAVGLLGAHTPDESVAVRIANHARNHHLDVVVVCDPDPAGRRLADTLAPLLHRHGVDAAVVTPPDGVDLNAWALTEPAWPDRLDRLVGHDRVDIAETTVGIDVVGLV